MSDRLPPFITVDCEGSNLVGHPQWRGDVLRGGVMCQMCGGWFTPDGAFDAVPAHKRPDILAMLDRGDYS